MLSGPLIDLVAVGSYFIRAGHTSLVNKTADEDLRDMQLIVQVYLSERFS